MNFKVLLRTDHLSNPFRHWVLKALRCPDADCVLICSGFFQEYFRPNYGLSADVQFMRALRGKHVVTLGVHNHAWVASYRRFRDALMARNISVIAFRSKRLHWHAKVFILYRKQVPVFAIIGSSNMTRNAFALPISRADYNNEADVVLWDSSIPEIHQHFTTEETKQSNERQEISLNYSRKENNGITIQQRLADVDQLVQRAMSSMEPLD